MSKDLGIRASYENLQRIQLLENHIGDIMVTFMFLVRRVFSYFTILCFINYTDPDEMPHFVQSHPSLYCL